MQLSRRSFTAGAVSAAVAGELPLPAFAQANSQLAAALAAIGAFAEADLALNRLPGMTLGIVTPDGRRTVLNFGYANAGARTRITSNTLFQVGSITKVMVAAMLHQFAADGRMRLTDRIGRLLPEIPLPAGDQIQVQQLIDHVAGLPADAPVFPSGELWTGYAPGAHWYYSNTGYEILGKLAERVGGKPLPQLLRERIFAPLGMKRSRGAIVRGDLPLYAQGYGPADEFGAYARGDPLVPAPWIDFTSGAGCVASTADDMIALLRSLASAAQGKGGLGLSPLEGRQLTSHSVASDTPGMRYGNGLMHVANAGRTYLHHTGGMLSFSSSFHVDVASGVGAFASANLSALAGYRPRLLTLFAVEALTDALNGRAVPAPPPLEAALPNSAAYLGRYSGTAGWFEVQPGSPLTIVADGQSAPLLPWSDEVFRTAHPQFRSYSLMFERVNGAVAIASWGPNSYARQGSGASLPRSDPALAGLAGRYLNDDPWYGPTVVVERGGKLWMGTETPMTPIGENLWRVGKEIWSPERASFGDFTGGRPQTLTFSGVKYARRNG